VAYDDVATDAGAVLQFSGTGDTVLRRCTDPLAADSDGFGSSLAAIGDLTGDGVADFVAREMGNLPGASQAGVVLLVSSADCAIVARLSDPAPITAGTLALDGLAVPGDLNGDGRPDIVAGADTASPIPRGHVVVFSETSSCESPDNCPAVSNPFQLDSDGDILGNLCDTCPADPNLNQQDGDFDGAGDACDCQPANPAVRLPGDRLRIDVTSQSRILWTAAVGAGGYYVWRGDLASRAYGAYGACWQHVIGPRAGDVGVVDATTPAVGSGFFYLVQGGDSSCGRGLLGFDSLERPRVGSGPGVCP